MNQQSFIIVIISIFLIIIIIVVIIVTSDFFVADGLQAAKLIAVPDKSKKNVSEGEVIKMNCQQIFGVIDPADPRTRPKVDNINSLFN